MWQQELMWVKRNERGVIVGISEELPDTDNFIPALSEEKGVHTTHDKHSAAASETKFITVHA